MRRQQRSVFGVDHSGDSPIDQFLSAIQRTTGIAPTRTPNGWRCPCPAHDDSTPSLSIAAASDGKVLVNCHAGCSTANVVGAAGLQLRDLFSPSTSTEFGRSRETSDNCRRNGDAKSSEEPDPSNAFPTVGAVLDELERRHGTLSGNWAYHDAAGERVGIVVRWDQPDGSKEFRPAALRLGGWRIEGMAKPHPLYGLPHLAMASRVYVCEGEKAADAARELGLTATTSPHGSHAAGSADWGPLAGKNVVLLPDNDAAGHKYADAVAAKLATLTPRPTVRIVDLPGLPDKGDVVDWIAEHAIATPDALKRELESLADATAPTAAARPPATEQFQPFPVDALPEPLRKLVMAGANSICCDHSFIALPLLTVCASAIGNSRRILLKRGWAEPPILWTAIVGESGTQKSPAFSLVLRPLRARQQRAMEQYADDWDAHERALLEHDRDLSTWKKSKEGGVPPDAPVPPTAARYIISDTTVEALSPLLRDNPRGLLLGRDELNGWLGSFDRYAKGGKGGGDSAHWLSIFNAETILVDRRTGGGPIYVPSASVCVTGGIQPGVLHRSLGMEHRESGLAARLLLSCPPRRPKKWTEAEISPHVEKAYADLIDRLFALQLAIDDEGRPTPALVRLSADAKQLYVDFCNAHGEEGAELTGDLAAAWSKLEGYAARLALVLHCVSAGDKLEIQGETMAAALRLTAWFKLETGRVYAMLGESASERRLRLLAEWIGRKGGIVTARDVQQGQREYRDSASKAEEALDALLAAGYGSWHMDTHGGGRGRPVRRFVLLAEPVYENHVSTPFRSNSVDVDVDGDPATPLDDEEWGEIE